MRLIGITGSIACGKSTVSRELVRRGYPVIDGDSLSRELTGPRGRAMNEIRSVFGDRYVMPDGSLNRREMGRLVFSEPAALERLDQVMGPYLQELTFSRIESVRSSGAALCFLDMPLLFEKGYDRFCDTVWCVWLPEELQLQRLMARDGFTREEALSRVRSVLSSDEKADRSAVVIDNSGTVEDTLLQVTERLETEMARVQSAAPRRRRSAPSSVPAPASQPYQVPDMGFERPDAARKKASSRKVDPEFPRWLTVSLISLCAVLLVSFTARLLMKGYLVRRQETHIAEQQAVDAKYPLMYNDIIVKYAAEFNVSPSLVAAVIMNESSFRPEVESPVGARGLMQLMPDTAEWIAHKLKLDNSYSFEDIKKPDTNIRFGCWYLNYLGSLFNGDPLCVVCAYHAGQGEISSWLSNPLYSTDAATLDYDSLPDGPTKLYAGRVTRDYGVYHAKYYSKNDSADSGDSAPASR